MTPEKSHEGTTGILTVEAANGEAVELKGTMKTVAGDKRVLFQHGHGVFFGIPLEYEPDPPKTDKINVRVREHVDASTVRVHLAHYHGMTLIALNGMNGLKGLEHHRMLHETVDGIAHRHATKKKGENEQSEKEA